MSTSKQDEALGKLIGLVVKLGCFIAICVDNQAYPWYAWILFLF